MRLPVCSSQTSRRSPSGRIGGSESTSSSTSIFRRDRLSTIVTSWPRADRWRLVGHPQKPSPPRIRIFIGELVLSFPCSVGGARHERPVCPFAHASAHLTYRKVLAFLAKPVFLTKPGIVARVSIPIHRR